jgi:hypothetical protein
MDIKLKFDTQKVTKKLLKNMGKLQPILNNQVIKDSNYYAPKDVGTLQSSAIKGTDMNSKTVKWATPYAHRLYNGLDFQFSKDENPNAQAKWFEVAKAKKKKEWIRMLNNANNR